MREKKEGRVSGLLRETRDVSAETYFFGFSGFDGFNFFAAASNVD